MELLSCDKGPTTNFIQIKFTFKQIFLQQWEIDLYTLEHITAVTEATEHSKFRLSLHSYYNTLQDSHYSYITAYNHGRSTKTMFLCSEAYAAKISLLKDMENPDQMIFTSATAFEVDGVRTNHESKEDKIFYPRGKGNWNPSLPKVFAVTLVITILSLYFIPSYSYISKIVFAKVNTSESKLTQPQNSARDVTFELQPFESSTGVDINTALLPTTNASKSSNEVPKKPNVTLDKAVNFSIPRGSVAITFDDGPSIHTKDIVNILEKYHVGGTFFFVGTQVKKYPESVKYVDDYDFSIGNHSMSHANLSNLSIEKQRFELEGNNRLIESIISKPVLLFRPPYGSRDVSLSELTAKNNMKMVLWNNDPEDWHKQSQKTLDYIFQTRSTGAIILLHESKETLQILPTIIEYLQNQQLNIVNLN